MLLNIKELLKGNHMKIGIIIHSHTGNTLQVGERIKEKLIKDGHDVTLEQVVAVNEDPNSTLKVELKNSPDISEYEYVILGAPVRAFSLSPVMKKYLLQLTNIKDKKFSCFVTEQLPKAWLGGNRAVKQMKKIILLKEALVINTGVVNWSNKNREEQIIDIINKF